jgi:HAD superfamily hydrolase (TIGR01548 family)
MNPLLPALKPYVVPAAGAPCDLRLDGNEGLGPTPALAEAMASLTDAHIQRYPKIDALHHLLCARHAVRPEQLVVTAGADDALYRAMIALLGPGRALVVPTPTFEMIPRYALLSGGQVRELDWPHGPFPLDAALAAAQAPDVGVIALVTPNNPTGGHIAPDAIVAIAQAAPRAFALVDLAYVEFDQHGDPTDWLLREGPPNIIITRTLSKAWGLAGLRVGYAVARDPHLITALTTCGNPYAVSAPSAHIAASRLTHDAPAVAAFIERARRERAQLAAWLTRAGGTPTDSQANFAFARMPSEEDAMRLRDLFAGLGIAVRAFPGRPKLADAVRMSCPGDEAAMRRIALAFEALEPEAILLDMDGVMVDVSTSYRAAILQTARAFGVEATPDDIHRAKLAGDANNDWIVTQRIIEAAGIHAPLDAVTARFEALYQGTGDIPGLWTTERPLMDRAWLAALKRATGAKLGVVTGRPRPDAERHLAHQNLTDLIDAMVCMGEAARPKPDAAPVVKAMELLGAKTAWMLGDTPDDVRAARAATMTGTLAVVPIGVLAPGDGEVMRAALIAAGAGRVLERVTELDPWVRRRQEER